LPLRCDFGSLKGFFKVDFSNLARETGRVCAGQIAEAQNGKPLFREAEDLSPVAEESAAVFNDLQAAIGSYFEPKREADLLTVIQDAAREHLGQEISLPQPVVIKVPIS